MITGVVVSCVAAVSAAQVDVRVLLLGGEDAPNGGVHEQFSSAMQPTLTESNEVFVQNIIADGARERAFLRLGALGSREIVLIDGTPLDGGGTVGGGSPVSGDFTVNPIITPDGRLAFGTAIDGVPNDQNSGIFLIDPDSGVTTQLAREGQAFTDPAGNPAVLLAFSFGQIPVARFAVDAAGNAVFEHRYDTDSGILDAILGSTSSGIESVFSEGELIPDVGSTTTGTSAFSFLPPNMNPAGTAVFFANGAFLPDAIVADNGIARDFVLRTAEPLSIGPCSIGDILNLDNARPAINSAGQIAVSVNLDARNDPPLGCPEFVDGSLVMRFEPNGGFSLLARNGTNVPGTGSFVASIRSTLLSLNEAGEVAMEVDVSGAGRAIVVTDGNTIATLAFAGDSAAGGGQYRASFESFALNDAGQVAFVDQIDNVPPDDSRETGLFLYTPGVGTELLLRTGQLLNGLELTAIDLAGNDGNGQRRLANADGFNNDGTVAFRFAAADGTTGIAIAGEDLPQPACSTADIAPPFGVVDLGDIDVFIAAFVAGDVAADLAAPFGVIDLGDIDAFIAAFLAGCA